MSAQQAVKLVLLKRVAMARDLAAAAGPEATTRQWVPKVPTASQPAGIDVLVRVADAYRAEADGLLWALTHGTTREYSADAAVQAAFDRGLREGLEILRAYPASADEAEA